MARFTLADLAILLNAKLLTDDKKCAVDGIATLQEAKGTQISFYSGQASYHEQLLRTKAAAVILGVANSKDCPVSSLIVEEPYLCYARASKLFGRHQQAAGRKAGQGAVHPSACIHEDARIHAEAVVGPYCCVGTGTDIGAGTILHAHVHIGRGCQLGEDCRLDPGVCIEDGVQVGNEVTMHANTVVGSDGFGYAWDSQRKGWEKIHQIGSVRIGNRVELGAMCTINRGALGDTIIEDGTKMDSQVHIGHNARVGAHSALAASCAIGGSTVLGEGCRLGGGVCIVNNLRIAKGVEIISNSTVFQDIKQPGRYGGHAAYELKNWRRNVLRQPQMHELFARVTDLEKHRS
jgi:UDP-3-O-[3-hydroxymyristoyl] glucosamine N-acyltransferase